MTNYKDSGENREVGVGTAAPNGSDGGENPAEFGPGARGPGPSEADLFLSPHSDDICFSLGDLALRRHAGTLMTVFSRSAFLAAPPAGAPAKAEEVTARRLAEDAAFAAACSLKLEDLGLMDAPLRGDPPFVLDGLPRQVEALEPVLMERIKRIARALKPKDRPWLFCPSGIGGHLDHAAIMTVVARNLDMLQETYRVCFYEDLHYAASVLARSIGLRQLAQTLPRFTLTRRQWPVADDGNRKLDLIRLYPSQLEFPAASLARFSPAIYLPEAPHEAVWTPARRG